MEGDMSMKSTMKRTVSILICICMMANLEWSGMYSNVVSAATVKEQDEMGERKELPQAEGELSYDELQTAELAEEEIPEVMNTTETRRKGHVHRLRDEESDLDSAVFQNRDGTKSMYLFSQSIKFMDDNGEVQDKSNKLSEDINDPRFAEDYAYVNNENDVNTYFPEKLVEDTGVILTWQDAAIEISPVAATDADKIEVESEEEDGGEEPYADVDSDADKAEAEPEEEDDGEEPYADGEYSADKVEVEPEEEDSREEPYEAVDYRNIFGEDTIVRYTPQFNGFKEDIILDSNIGVNEFSFTLKTGGLRLVEQEGSYCLRNPETGEDLFELGNIVVYDSKEQDGIGEPAIPDMEYAHAYRMETVEEDSEYLVTIVVDKGYLDSPDTVYPVTIDPSVITITSGGMQDAPLLSGCKSSFGSYSASLHAGNYKLAFDSSYQTGRALVRFPGLFSNKTIKNLKANEIVSVKYIPRDVMCYSSTTTVNCYRVTKAWNEDTVYYTKSIWNAYDSTKLDGNAVTYNGGTGSTGTGTGHYYPFDITKAVKDWINGLYGGKSNHYGIMLKAANESQKAITFGSRKHATCPPSVVVTWNEPTGLTITPGSRTIDINSTLKLNPKVAPSAASQRVKWTTSNSAVASVSSAGVVSGKKAGTATIKAASAVKSSITASITVKVVAPTGITMSPASATIDIKTTRQLSATLAPSDLANKAVTWSTANAAVATVSASGLVTATGGGKTTVTATSVLDTTKKATCSITVRTPTVSLPIYTTPLPLDSIVQLSASVTGITNTAVTWSTGNANIATVSSTGLVTAKAKGAVTITATSVQDTTKKNTCTITVTGPEEKRFYGIPGGYAPTGNYSETFTDITIPSVLGDIPLSRSYNSLESTTSSIVGKGFHFNYSMRIADDPRDTSKTYVIMPDSAWWCFTKNSNGTYTARDCRGTLIRNASTLEYTFETLNQMRYGFTSAGYLEYVEDFKGNRITVKTDTVGKITAMTDITGLSVSFTYSGSLLTKITDNVSGRTVQYAYSNNCLKTVTYPGGIKTLYDYASGLLVDVTSSSNDGLLTREESSIAYNTSGAYGGLVDTVTDDQGLMSTYDYTLKPSKQVKITDDNSITTQTYNNAFALLLKQVAPENGARSYLEDNTLNQYHEVTRSVDECGNITNYSYDTRGNLIQVLYPDGATEKYTYDVNNNNISYTNKSGGATWYIYDGYNLVKVVRPINGVSSYSTAANQADYEITSYTYYTNTTVKGLMQTETGPMGDNRNYIEYNYNTKGKVIKKLVNLKYESCKIFYSYDTAGRLERESVYPGDFSKFVHTRHTYNSMGLLQSTTVSDAVGTKIWRSTEKTYDGLGQELNDTQADGSSTTYTYDEKGNVKSEKDANGDITTYEYNNEGNLKKETLPNGAIIDYSYDELLRVTAEEFDGDEQKKIEYSVDTARKISIVKTTDVRGETTVEETGYDGRLLTKTDPNGLKQINTYDRGGRLIREEYKDGSSVMKWVEYTYDPWDRKLTETSSFDNSGSAKVKYTYDKNGNVLTESVKNSVPGQLETWSKTGYVYDAWGNTLQVVYYEGNTPVNYIQYYYDWDGEMLREYKGLTSPLTITGLDRVQNPSDQDYSVIKYEYDGMRQLISKTDAAGESETYQYDQLGRLIYTKDRNGAEHTVEYDKMGNATKKESKHLNNGQSVKPTITKNFTYDSMGNLRSADDGGAITTYSYDRKGNRIREENGNTVKTFAYNDADQVTESIITIRGIEEQKIQNNYNSYGQLTEVLEKDILKASYTYDVMGQVTSTTNANGTCETNTYNSAGLVTSTVNRKGEQLLSQYDYTYYYDGNQRTKTDGSGTSTYIYDGRGQLTKAFLEDDTSDNFENATEITPENQPAGATIQEYTYDANGNRTKLKETNNGVVNETAYTYDKNDRLITEKKSSQTVTYTYDKNGNLTGKTDGTVQVFDLLNRMTSYKKGGTTAAYTYYPDNMRKSKGRITHVWIDDEIALDLVFTRIVVSSYIHGNKLIQSGYGWYLYNAHGDVTALTNSSGEVIRNYEYDPYGKQRSSVDTADNNPYRYCGEYYDKESGYTYLRARYYDPAIGRFINEDPALDGYNWYIYCANNPINYIDPSGQNSVVLDWQPAVGALLTLGSVSGVVLSAVAVGLIVYSVYGCYRIIKYRVTYRPYSSSSSSKRTKSKPGQTKPASSTANKGAGKANIKQAKGGKQNVRDSGFIGVSNKDILEGYQNSTGAEKKRYEKELKARQEKNKAKRENNNKSKKSGKKK